MERNFALGMILGLGALLGLSGCTGAALPSPTPSATASVSRPSPNHVPVVATPWKLRWTHQCRDLAREECVGAYGFSVDNSGGYQVGPGPAEEILSGNLTEQELGTLRDEIVQSLRTPQGCGKDDDDVLEFNSERFCAGTRKLHEMLHDLATRYSPAKFPNSCIDASMSLDASYRSMQHCEQDSDCVYVGDDFLPLRPSEESDFESDDCSYLHPMLFGNSFLVVSNQLELLMKRDLAKKVCGNDLMRSSCRTDQKMDMKRGELACVDQVCRMGRLK